MLFIVYYALAGNDDHPVESGNSYFSGAILMSNQTVLGSLAISVEELEGTKRLFVIQPGL
jgi:hypothetical protein